MRYVCIISINIIWTTFEAKVATQFVQNHVAEKESAAMIFMTHPYECRYFKLEIFSRLFEKRVRITSRYDMIVKYKEDSK